MGTAGTIAGAISASARRARTSATGETSAAPPGSRAYRGIPSGTNGAQHLSQPQNDPPRLVRQRSRRRPRLRRARELFGAFAYLNFPHAGRIVSVSGRIMVHSHVRGRARSTNPKFEYRQLRRRRMFAALPEIRNKFELPKFKIQNRTRPADRLGHWDYLDFRMTLVSSPISNFVLRDSPVRDAHRTARHRPSLFDNFISFRHPPIHGNRWGKCCLQTRYAHTYHLCDDGLV